MSAFPKLLFSPFHRVYPLSLSRITKVRSPWMIKAITAQGAVSLRTLTTMLPCTARGLAWRELEDHPLSKDSLASLFSNTIPSIRVPGFLSEDECQRLLNIVKTSPMVHPLASLQRRPH